MAASNPDCLYEKTTNQSLIFEYIELYQTKKILNNENIKLLLMLQKLLNQTLHHLKKLNHILSSFKSDINDPNILKVYINNFKKKQINNETNKIVCKFNK